MTDTPKPRAFPSNAIDPAYGGMELRDHFAGLAMAAIITKGTGPFNADVLLKLVKASYAVADAMMIARVLDGPSDA